jgi:hypothetical protein
VSPQPLAERILLERGPELRDQLAVLAERKCNLEALLQCVDAQRLQAPGFRVEPHRANEPL